MGKNIKTEKIQENNIDLFKYFKSCPEKLDPFWADRNPRSPDVLHLHFKRWKFCFQLARGNFAYQYPRGKKREKDVVKGAKWPSLRNEKMLFDQLKNTNNDTQVAHLPLHYPWYSNLIILVPSAVHEFNKGNHKAVFDLAKLMPGLLMVRSETCSEEQTQSEMTKYLDFINEFQVCFRKLFANNEIRVTVLRRARKNPATMKQICINSEELINSGLNKDVVFSILKHVYAQNPHIKVYRSYTKREMRQKEEGWFWGGARILREYREKGGIPSKMSLVVQISSWIITQHGFRQFLKKHLLNSRPLSNYEQREDKKYDLLWKKCERYMHRGEVVLLPTSTDLVDAAEKHWPGLKSECSKYNILEIAECLLQLFVQTTTINTDDKLLSVPRMFHEAAFIYANSGLSEAKVFIKKTKMFIKKAKEEKSKTNVSV